MTGGRPSKRECKIVNYWRQSWLAKLNWSVPEYENNCLRKENVQLDKEKRFFYLTRWSFHILVIYIPVQETRAIILIYFTCLKKHFKLNWHYFRCGYTYDFLTLFIPQFTREEVKNIITIFSSVQLRPFSHLNLTTPSESMGNIRTYYMS